MWKQAGINATLHFYPLAGLIQQFDTKKWEIALQTAGAWDPAGGVGLAFRFLSLSPFSGVHDPKLDALILGGQAAVDPATRKSTYDQAAAYIANNADGPFLPPAGQLEHRGQGRAGRRSDDADSPGRRQSARYCGRTSRCRHREPSPGQDE